MDIRKMLINSNQEILDLIERQEYQLSRQIMKLRYDLSLSEKEISDILNIPFEKYLSFEYGNTNISE